MALNIIKKIKQLSKYEKQLAKCEKEIEALAKLYDEKNKLYQRALRRANYFEGKLKELHESNLVLTGQLKHQNMVMEYLHKQNTDLLLKSREKAVLPPTIRVLEVRMDGKAENSNS